MTFGTLQGLFHLCNEPCLVPSQKGVWRLSIGYPEPAMKQLSSRAYEAFSISVICESWRITHEWNGLRFLLLLKR